MASFIWDSFWLFFCGFGVLVEVLGLTAGGSGVGLLAADVPFTWDCAGDLVFFIFFFFFFFFLPALGGWSPLAASGLAAATSCVVASGLRFLRFLVSGKKPFFFRFMLTGVCCVA